MVTDANWPPLWARYGESPLSLLKLALCVQPSLHSVRRDCRCRRPERACGTAYTAGACRRLDCNGLAVPKCLHFVIRMYSCLMLGGRWSQRIQRSTSLPGVDEETAGGLVLETGPLDWHVGEGPSIYNVPCSGSSVGRRDIPTSAAVWLQLLQTFAEPSSYSGQLISVDLLGNMLIGMCPLLLSCPSVLFCP